MPVPSPLKFARRGLMLSFAVTTAAPATVRDWQSSLGSGSWNVATNWSPAPPPGAADVASISASAATPKTAHTITVPTPVTVLGLILGRSAATLDVPAGSGLTVTGTDTPSTGINFLQLNDGKLNAAGQVVATSVVFRSGQVLGTIDFPSTAVGKLMISNATTLLGGGFRFNGSGEVTGVPPVGSTSTTGIGAILKSAVTLTARAVADGVAAQLKFPNYGASYGTVTLESAAGVSDSVVSLAAAASQTFVADFANYGALNLNAGGTGANTRVADASVDNKSTGVVTVAIGVTASFNRLLLNAGTLNVNGPTTFVQNLSNAAGGVINLRAAITVAGTFTNLGTLNLAAPVTLSSAVTGSGTLVASAAGITTLSGANAYTGATRVTHAQATLVATPAAYDNVLTNAGGLDVAAGAFVFQYDTGVAPAAPTPVGTVRTLLRGGFPNGLVTGQLRSSAATAERGLGYADDGHGVTLRPAYYGDADLDGGVSINDFNALAANFGVGSGAVWTQGDFDYDGGVSINDFNLLAANFGKSTAAAGDMPDYTGLLAFAAAHDDLHAFERVTGVPEPTGVAALAGVVGNLLVRRRRPRR